MNKVHRLKYHSGTGVELASGDCFTKDSLVSDLLQDKKTKLSKNEVKFTHASRHFFEDSKIIY